MATSGSWLGSRTVTNGPQLRLLWERTSVDIPSNRSRIRLTLQIYSQYHASFSASKSGVLQGSSFTYTGGYNGTGYKTVQTRDIWVSHNSDGTKSITFSGSLSMNLGWSTGNTGTSTVSGTATLDTIPRASSLTSFRVYNSLAPNTSCRIDLGITRHSSSFDHAIYLKHGSTVIQSWANQGTPTTLTISSTRVNTLLGRLNNSTSGTLTLEIATYSGSTKIRRNSSRTATATVNSGVVPSISGFNTWINGSGRDNAIGKYVQSISRVSYSMSRSAGYGASVSSTTVVVRKDSNHYNSMTVNGPSGTTGVVNNNGLYEAIATVRDSRGRTATSRLTFTVENYSLPRITTFTATRTSANDTIVSISRHGNHTPLGTDNPLTAVVSKRVSGGTWVEIDGSFSNYTGTGFGNTYTDTGVSSTASYEYRLVITDSFGKTTEATETVSTAKVVLDIHKNDGIGIGKMHEQGVLDVEGDAHVEGDLYVRGISQIRSNSFSALNVVAEDTIPFWQQLPQGTYWVSTGQLPNQPSNYGFMIHSTQLSGSGTDFTTLWYTQASGTIYRKSGNRSTNNPWVPIDRPDSGSNSNGDWVRFNDGTQICYRTATIDLNSNGWQYYNHAMGFLDIPSVSSQPQLATNSAHRSAIEGTMIFASTDSQIRALVLRDRIAVTHTFGITAIGRWK